MAVAMAGYRSGGLHRDPSKGRLSRAGWSLVSSGSQASLKAVVLEPMWEVEGARLVAEVAACWSDKYLYTIRHSGAFEGAFHYECLFSRPTESEPVPSVVIAARFALIVLPPGAPAASATVRLLYSFEEGDLRHEWALEREPSGRWRATLGQQNATLNCKAFEWYLDAYIREKVKVRSRGIDVTTKFEASRLTPPPQCYPDDSLEEASGDGPEAGGEGQVDAQAAGQDLESQEMAQAMKEALKAANMYCDKVSPPSSLTELLANIFDAADEEDVGELPHLEVARVLSATLSGFGLEEWDIQLLLTSAQETEEGYIEWKPFIQAAPEMIQALRTRRRGYKARGMPGVEIPSEAIQHCFHDEMMSTVEALMAAFEGCVAEDPSRGRLGVSQAAIAARQGAPSNSKSRGSPSNMDSPAGGDSLVVGEEKTLVAMKRCYARECIESLTERLSPQEASRLMQMLPEDEYGFVVIDDLEMRLEHLRTQALLNGLVETSISALRTHLVLNFRKVGMTPDGKMKVWQCKSALLACDQVCLSRLQIHTLLCFAGVDESGWVDVAIFCGICCMIIPHMCDPKIFVETAERLEMESAEAAKERANAELAALGAPKRANESNEASESKEQHVEVDQETVERTLNQVFALSDNNHRSPPTLPADTIFLLLHSNNDQVMSCALSEAELCGLAAEMAPDASGEVPYQQFLKKWIPVTFETRKSQLFGSYLKDDAAETMGIPEPDFGALEKMFPLQPPGLVKMKEGATESKEAEGDSRVIRRMATEGGRRSGSKLMSRTRSLRGGEQREKTIEAEPENAVKEPPPGRGYHRRRQLLVDQGVVFARGQPGTSSKGELPQMTRSKTSAV